MSGRRGFTLVELAAVILVLGILATLGMPRIMSAKERAHRAAMTSDLRNLVNEQEAYSAEHGAYASRLADLAFTPTANVSIAIVTAGESGWNAVATFTGSTSSCSAAYGTAPTLAPGARPDGIYCQ